MQARKWIIPVILVSVFIFLLSLRQLSDPDLGFHLKYGKWITENHRVPATDLSTYTVSQHPYIDLHWLFQVILYQVFRLTGYPGISLFICLLATLLSLLMMLRNRIFSIPVPITTVGLFVAFLIIDPRIAPRPEMFTFLFLSGALLILELYAESRRNLLCLLPVIMLFWCNTHALFVLGLILIVIYLISHTIHHKTVDRQLLFWGFISLLACFLNPYGIRGFSLPLELLTRFDPNNIYNQHIQEFIPFFAQQHFVIRDYLFLTVIVITLFFTAFTLRNRKFHDIVLLLIFSMLALGSVRNIPLFVLVAFPILSRESAQLTAGLASAHRFLHKLPYWIMILLPLALATSLLAGGWYPSNNSFNKTGTGIDELHQPVRAAGFITGHHLDGRILNSIGYGGWLSWALPQPVFIDGRLEVMQEPLYKEITASWAGGLPALVNKYHPQLIIYNYLKYYPWNPQLQVMPDWRPVYLDGDAVIFTCDTNKTNLPTIELTRYASYNPMPGHTSVSERLPAFYRPPDRQQVEMQHMALFSRQFLSATPVKRATQGAVAFFNAANSRFRKGDLQGALACYDTAIMLNPGYVKAYNNRGILHAEALKEYKMAIADFDKAIGLDPTNGDAFLGRGTVYFYLHDMQKACRDWNSALSFGNVQASRLIGLHCPVK
ncbi:MAG: tetratricopeptide repeat protein [Bacteroidota bacterium]